MMATYWGTTGDDSITALPGGDDLVVGGPQADPRADTGADLLAGLDGTDTLRGFGGNDALDGGAGDDVLDGGAGDDTLRGDDLAFGSLHNGADRLSGRSGADELRGGNGSDVLRGGDGNDVLWSQGVALLLQGLGLTPETLRGGAGDDVLHVEDGAGRAAGGAGTDVLHIAWINVQTSLRASLSIDGTLSGNGPLRASGFEMVSIDGGQAADRFVGGAGSDTLFGFGGDDVLRGGVGQDFLHGWEGTDLLFGGAGDDGLVGGTGADRLHGEAGDDGLSGADGDDLLRGGEGKDTLAGGEGTDTLDGGTGADRMDGGSGDDLYFVDDAGDVAEEAGFPSGIDEVRASVDFTLGFGVEDLTLRGTAREGTGNSLANRIIGNAEDNLLLGLNGRDTLRGGAGDDTLVGGDRNDLLIGGGGQDAFRFLSPRDGGDSILGFDPGRDRIEIVAAGFGAGLVAGQPLTAEQFEANATGHASAATARFVYDTTTGWLRFDADGSGLASLRVAVALLDGMPALTAADIVIIA